MNRIRRALKRSSPKGEPSFCPNPILSILSILSNQAFGLHRCLSRNDAVRLEDFNAKARRREGAKNKLALPIWVTKR